jgi:hypothetical protein
MKRYIAAIITISAEPYRPPDEARPVNATHPQLLVSHRLLIDDGHTSTLQDYLGIFRAGSVFILDEAHHAAPASGQRYAIDTKITKAIRDLAPCFEHRLSSLQRPTTALEQLLRAGLTAG